jgi:hypothetical protein
MDPRIGPVASVLPFEGIPELVVSYFRPSVYARLGTVAGDLHVRLAGFLDDVVDDLDETMECRHPASEFLAWTFLTVIGSGPFQIRYTTSDSVRVSLRDGRAHCLTTNQVRQFVSTWHVKLRDVFLRAFTGWRPAQDPAKFDSQLALEYTLHVKGLWLERSDWEHSDWYLVQTAMHDQLSQVVSNLQDAVFIPDRYLAAARAAFPTLFENEDESRAPKRPRK